MTLRQIYRSVVICIRSVKRIVVRSFKIRHGKPLRYSVNIILRNVMNFNEIDLYSEWQMYSGPWLVRRPTQQSRRTYITILSITHGITPDEGPSLETSKFSALAIHFQVVVSLPMKSCSFYWHYTHRLHWQRQSKD
jgi:hypothetical protein